MQNKLSEKLQKLQDFEPLWLFVQDITKIYGKRKHEVQGDTPRLELENKEHIRKMASDLIPKLRNKIEGLTQTWLLKELAKISTASTYKELGEKVGFFISEFEAASELHKDQEAREEVKKNTNNFKNKYA